MGLFRKKWQSYDEWCETKRGRELNEKFQKIAEENARKKAEWEENTPVEKKEQVKLFKIIFTPFFLSFVAALYWGFLKYCVLWVFGAEALVALVSFILFKFPPKKVKYPNCFMMPVIALASAAVFSPIIAKDFGFDRYIKFKPDAVERELSETEKEFYNNDYAKWLEESGLETKKELKKDYKDAGGTD